MKALSFTAMVLSLLIFCSCKKSKEEEYKVWSDKADSMIRTSDWVTTNGMDLKTNKGFSEFTNMFRNTIKSDNTAKTMVEIANAEQYLAKLHQENQLPGASKDDHGQVAIDFQLMVSNKLVEAVYPMERTFLFVKEEEIFTNHYTVVKLSKDSEWKLQKAWRTDTEGNVIQEWPVK